MTIRLLSSKSRLGFSNSEIRRDFLLEKRAEFSVSATYLEVRKLYLRETGKAALFAELPFIDLSSPRISHKMTTASYAASVDRRYQKCMAVK